MERVTGGYSLHSRENPDLCKRRYPYNEPCGNARVVKCDGGNKDIVECSKCGKQWETRCTFDDDCS